MIVVLGMRHLLAPRCRRASLRALILASAFCLAAFTSHLSRAATLTVDGNLGDWGFVVADNNGSSFIPAGGLQLLGIAVEDQNDFAGDNAYLGPYNGGQNYDAELLAAAVQGPNLFISIVTGQRPDNGLHRFAPGDIQIHTTAGLYRIEVGGGVGGGPGGAIVENAGGSTYGIDSDGWSTGLVSTPSTQKAGTIWANSWGVYYNQLQNPGATKIGTADYIYTRNSVTTQHAIIELSLPLALFAGQQLLSIDWAAACNNDALEIDVCNVPEPSSAVLAVLGLVGLFTWRRRQVVA